MPSTVDKFMGNPYVIILSTVFLVSSTLALHTIDNIKLPPALENAGHYQFLTNLSLAITVFYFSINLLYHTLKLESLSTLKKYFSAICFALDGIVSLVYWSLRATVPDLIIPEDQREFLTLTLDLQIHLFPIVAVALDYMLFMKKWDISYSTGYLIVAVFAIGYWFLLEYLIDEDAAYPYPFLDVEKSLRIVIFLVVSFVAFGSFCIGKLVHPESIPLIEKAEQDYTKTK